MDNIRSTKLVSCRMLDQTPNPLNALINHAFYYYTSFSLVLLGNIPSFEPLYPSKGTLTLGFALALFQLDLLSLRRTFRALFPLDALPLHGQGSQNHTEAEGGSHDEDSGQ